MLRGNLSDPYCQVGSYSVGCDGYFGMQDGLQPKHACRIGEKGFHRPTDGGLLLPVLQRLLACRAKFTDDAPKPVLALHSAPKGQYAPYAPETHGKYDVTFRRGGVRITKSQ